MTKNEKLIIQDELIRIMRNCEFYEGEERTEALKQEIGRLAQTLHIAFELGVSTNFIIDKAERYINIGSNFRKEEDEKATEYYRKLQKELIKNNEQSYQN